MSEWDQKEMLKSIDDYFDNTTREQSINDLQEAGFEVEDGQGEIIFTDVHDELKPKKKIDLSGNKDMEHYNSEDDFKLDKYEWTVYITTELLKCELDELVEKWDTPYYAYKRGKAATYAETLHNLTGDEKWLMPLEKLKERLMKEEGDDY